MDGERRDIDPGEMTRRMPEGEGAGPGAPETLGPTHAGEHPEAPGGPPMHGLARDTPAGDGEPSDRPPESARPDPPGLVATVFRSGVLGLARLGRRVPGRR